MVLRLHGDEHHRLGCAPPACAERGIGGARRQLQISSAGANRASPRKVSVCPSISSKATPVFGPIDFRIRFTPEFNLNFLQTRERGLVNVDVRDGTNRFDTHAGVQEGFVEAKIHDLSPNFDFISVRAGIQQFVSDFRGFIFAEEQPGVRLFGNLRSNRINYNLAWFYFLEKNTNSGLNTFERRHQQVYVGNVYIQDFFAKGYTTEFSFHYNRDDPVDPL